MKIIIHNDKNIKDDEINIYEYRARGVIINSNDEILMGLCDNNYQFPGGHLNEGETLNQTLKREIMEETGIILEEEYEPFYQIKYYDKQDDGTNKYTEFNYYLIETDKLPDINNTNLDEYEKKGNYQTKFIKLSKLDNLLDATIDDHFMNKIMYPEIKDVIKTYKTMTK